MPRDNDYYIVRHNGRFTIGRYKARGMLEGKWLGCEIHVGLWVRRLR